MGVNIELKAKSTRIRWKDIEVGAAKSLPQVPDAEKSKHSAKLYRKRMKAYLEVLEHTVADLEQQVASLNETVNELRKENVALKNERTRR